MGAKTTTYTIKFNAQAESLNQVEKELQKIQKQSANLNLTGKEQERLQGLLIKVQELKKSLTPDAKGGYVLDIKQFKILEKEFASIIKGATNFSSALIKMVPPELQAQIAQLNAQIDDLNYKSRALGAEKSKLTRSFNKQANTITAATIQNAGPGVNITDSSGNLISSYADLKKRAEELSQVNRDLTEQEKTVMQMWTQVEQKVEGPLKAYVEAWNKADQSIRNNKVHIEQLNTQIQNLPRNAPLQWDENSKATYSDFTQSIQALSSAIGSTTEQVQEYDKKVATGTQQQQRHHKQTTKLTQAYDKNRTTLGKAVHNVVSYGSALTLVRKIYTQFINTVKEMDRALTNMTVVTSLSREQAWKLTGVLQELATQTGLTTTEIANMTTMYLQQGKTLSDALELTEAAAKAARIAGISGSESINLLTNAMNGFQIDASKAEEVTDKFAALAASAATDYEELATALSKVAAQANLAGMSMDFTLGLLTKGIEVTREAPETIGTALKTVIARMRELNEYGETLEDGVDVNRVDKALSNIGVNLLNANREFRDLEAVLSEVGEKWDTLNVNQQANVAVALAGTRQQSRLIAIMQDFDRTQELVNISMNSAGATAAQHAKYMEGLEAATSQLTTAYQKLITNITSSDIVIKTLNGLINVLNGMAENAYVTIGVIAALAILYSKFSAVKQKDAKVTIFSYLAEQVRNTVSLIYLNIRKRELKLTRDCIQANMKDAKTNIEQAETVAFKIAQEKRLLKLRAAERKNLAQRIVLNSKLSSVMASNPYLLLAAVIVGLIAAWYQLNKETEKGIAFQEAIKNLFNALKDILTGLLSALMPIINALIDIIDLIMPLITFLLEDLAYRLQRLANIINWLGNAIQAVIDWYNNMIDAIMNWEPIKKATQLIGKLTSACKKLVKTVKGWFSFGSSSGSGNLFGSGIAKKQKKIYENQQLTGTLTPLIDEYEELRQKANKTTEDMERMAEIESQIGDMDDKYKLANGSIDWDKVKQEADTKSKETAELIRNNYDVAMYGFQLGFATDEMRLAVSDYFTDQIQQYAEDTANYSAATARAISKNFEIAIQTLSKEELITLSQTQDGFNQLYESVKSFEEVQEDANIKLSESVVAFQTQYDQLLKQSSDEAAKAFATTYAAYKTYYDLLQGLGQTGQQVLLQNLDTLGLTPAQHDAIYSAFMEDKTFRAQGEDESDKEYAAYRAAQQAEYDSAFTGYMQNALSKSTGTKTDLLQSLMQDKQITNAFRSALLNNLTSTNQATLEQYTKSLSKISNLEEFASKAKAGTLTMDEMRTVVMDNPELFDTEQEMKDFLSGKIDIEALKNKAKTTMQDELDAREKAIKWELTYNTTLTESAKQNYQAELQLIAAQREHLKYAELYASEIWTNAANVTNEMVRQKRLQSDLNSLAKELESTTDPNKRTAILQKQLALYKAMEANAQTILENANYIKAVQDGYIVDGEVVVTQEELKAMGEGDMWAWLDEYKDAIQEAYNDNEEALEGYRQIIEQDYDNKKAFLEKQKEQYEEYWDKLDAFEKEQERQQSRESVVQQLSTLAGGSDAATNNLRKNLLAQLADLDAEDAEARKQAIRDSITQDIDDKVTSIDEQMGSLVALTKAELHSKLQDLGYNIDGLEIKFDGTHGSVIDRATGNEVYKFKNGGLVDYTGPAWVDGTKSRPEAFLDANDTQLIASLVAALSYGSLHGVLSGDNVGTDTITIENINITTNELNTSQDFRKSGQIFAEEFAKAIKQRGVNVNVKR